MTPRFEDVAAVIVTRGDVDMSWTADLPYGEVIIWDNSKESEDHKVYGRYAGAARSQRPIVYFQDDDVRFHAHEALLESYTPGVLVANMYDQWIKDCGYVDLALPGLGSICDNGLWHKAHTRYSFEVGADPRFDLDCDFIFGALTPFRRIDFGHEILDIASADNRLWRQDGQFEGKWRTIRRARALREVCLAIMAKNEAENIERALESVLGWFDRLLLLDTGSTDDTVHLARNFCASHQLGFELLEREFTNFGEMRQYHLEQARTRGDYVLLMDADEEWIDLPTRPELWADGYVMHYEGEIDQAHIRLVNSNFPWYFDGKTHSVIGAPEGRTPVGVNLQTPLIRHHGWDRAGDPARFERDVQLLTEEIEAGNDVPRHLFLRAKAYEGLGKYGDAMLDYERRTELSQGDEESYYSWFRLGVLAAERLNDFETAARCLVQARKDRPTRNESLRALAFYATALADATPYPAEDMVLVHRDLYKTHQEV